MGTNQKNYGLWDPHEPQPSNHHKLFNLLNLVVMWGLWFGLTCKSYLKVTLTPFVPFIGMEAKYMAQPACI